MPAGHQLLQPHVGLALSLYVLSFLMHSLLQHSLYIGLNLEPITAHNYCGTIPFMRSTGMITRQYISNVKVTMNTVVVYAYSCGLCSNTSCQWLGPSVADGPSHCNSTCIMCGHGCGLHVLAQDILCSILGENVCIEHTRHTMK